MTSSTNRRILIVDDNTAIHADFHKVLAAREREEELLDEVTALLFGSTSIASHDLPFELDSAYQGQEALVRVEEACRHKRPYALAFVDVRMPPGWDGIETIQRLWQVDPHVQVVICTAHSDRSWGETVSMLKRTEQFLILKKPFDAVEVRQLAVSLTDKWELARRDRLEREQLEQAVAERTREVLAVQDVSLFALAKLAESRDVETGEHLERMRAYSQMLAERLRRSSPYADQIDAKFLDDLYRSSPLHDIGKVGIPDQILLKPGKLTCEEFEVMKRHSLIGAETLDRALRHTSYGGFLTMAVDIARYHHERFDGSGYPHGLRGEQIPLAARIVALADVYDALTSARVYKAAIDPWQAREMVLAEAGKQFDPVIVAAFEDCFPQFLLLRQVEPNTLAACAAGE